MKLANVQCQALQMLTICQLLQEQHLIYTVFAEISFFNPEEGKETLMNDDSFLRASTIFEAFEKSWSKSCCDYC